MANKKATGGADPAETLHDDEDIAVDSDEAQDTANAGQDDARLKAAMRQLVTEAMGRQGKVLYPRPQDMDPDRYRAAVDALVAAGHAHGGVYPNLTRAGIEVWQRSG